MDRSLDHRLHQDSWGRANPNGQNLFFQIELTIIFLCKLVNSSTPDPFGHLNSTSAACEAA
jgi:hypothetical protein